MKVEISNSKIQANETKRGFVYQFGNTHMLRISLCERLTHSASDYIPFLSLDIDDPRVTLLNKEQQVTIVGEATVIA